VTKTKDGKSLGSESTQKHESVERQIQIIKDIKNASNNQKKTMMEEHMKIYMMTGFLPRM